MRDQTLIWNTGITLQVTSLTARLRGFAEIGARAGDIHVSDLWDESGKAERWQRTQNCPAWPPHSSPAQTPYAIAESV